MARYSIGFTKTAVTAAGAIVDIATATTPRVRVIEFGWAVGAVSGTTPAIDIGLFRSSAVGTRTTPLSTLAEEFADTTATTTIATAWSIAPTLAANPLRRLPVNSIGSGIVWTFPDRGGLSIPISSSLVLSAISVTGTTPSFTISGYIVVDE